MKTPNNSKTTEEVKEAVSIVKYSTYKLTLPIDKKLSHNFQSFCKDLDTDASKQLRNYIERCVADRVLY